MKVFGWSCFDDACHYYRISGPLLALENRGHTVAWSCQPRWAKTFDLVLIQRPGLEKEQGYKTLRESHKVVVDLDDDLWQLPSYNPWYDVTDPADTQAITRIIKDADVVTVSTEPLAEVVKAMGGNPIAVPNAVPDWMTTYDRPRQERITLGWAGGNTHSADWREFDGAVRRCLERHPDVMLHMKGENYARHFESDQVIFTPWTDNVESHLKSIDFDIALAPLVTNGFNNSKSHIRALEASALGIPVIASDGPAYRSVVKHGVTGFLVREARELGEYLDLLIKDDNLRAAMGVAARAEAARFTTSKTATLWEGVFEQALT